MHTYTGGDLHEATAVDHLFRTRASFDELVGVIRFVKAVPLSA